MHCYFSLIYQKYSLLTSGNIEPDPNHAEMNGKSLIGFIEFWIGPMRHKVDSLEFEVYQGCGKSRAINV